MTKTNGLDGLDVAKLALIRYRKWPLSERRRLNDAGIGMSESLLILSMIITTRTSEVTFEEWAELERQDRERETQEEQLELPLG